MILVSSSRCGVLGDDAAWSMSKSEEGEEGDQAGVPTTKGADLKRGEVRLALALRWWFFDDIALLDR
jgi:hypothetical protein